MHQVKYGWRGKCLECLEKQAQLQPNLRFPVEPEPEQLTFSFRKG